MTTKTLGIIMHGITGRMGYNQHLVRSICAIRDQGGVALPNGDRIMPDPILVGRNADKIEAVARKHGITRTTTDMAAALANPADTVFFDGGSTQMRAGFLSDAIRAGKHVYCGLTSSAGPRLSATYARCHGRRFCRQHVGELHGWTCRRAAARGRRSPRPRAGPPADAAP